jgi:RNA-directed DNA polymerase
MGGDTFVTEVSKGHGGTQMTSNTPERREPLTRLRQLQRKLWTVAKRDKSRRFHALYDRIYRWDILEEAWRRVRQNRGSSGVDKETIQEIETKGVESFLRGIERELKEGRYRPKPVRRVMIDKSDGRKRPLGIPTVKDRVVQMATKLVIEPIFEADFKECSYGFRPKRSALQALERIRVLANKGRNIVLDADIQDYFGSIQHEKLMDMIKQRITDRRVLKLLRQWLKAGVMEGGTYEETEVGTPQGGVISPLLSNVYLNYLDKEWSEKHASWGELTRYADDFVVQCVSVNQVEVVKAKIQVIFRGLGLTLHPEKTRIVDLRWGKEGFDFLGHHLRKMPSYRFAGKYFLNRWPSQKSLSKVRERLKGIIHRKRFGVSSVRQLVPEINRTLQGWREYFRYGNANRQFLKMDHYLWDKLSQFECKRRFHQAPYRSSRYDLTWYQSLGVIPLAGMVRYPNPSLVLVKANV